MSLDTGATSGDSGRGMAVQGLQDVPHARHFVAARLRESGNEDLGDLAELVTTELVTNALLHGRSPISVDIHYHSDTGWARIEVADASPLVPEVGQGGADEMTGRGLALIDALAARWGSRPVPGGKVVWAELSDPAGTDLGSELDSDLDFELGFDAEHEGEREADEPLTAFGQTTLLRLPDVPVALLLASEAHVDDLVRDLTLAGSSSSRDRHDAVPAAVAARVSAAADLVDPIRRSLRRQALEGRAAGADSIAVTVPTGPDVLDEAREYLAALDEADSYCRAARLLTLEAPPQHRVLRRWMTDQILLATSGEPVTGNADGFVVQPFRDRLLEELAELAIIQRTAARAERLQRVATGLSEARTPEQVAGVVLEEGTAALGASRGAFLRLDDDLLTLTGALGMGQPALEWASRLVLDDRLPIMDAIRVREPVWVESLAERDRRYPQLAAADPASRSLVAAPLIVGGRVLGVLRFGFDADLVVDEDERRFVSAIAAQAGSALDRSLAYAAEHEARRHAELTASRLQRLQETTAALSGTLDESEVGAIVLGHATEALGARIGTLCLLDRPGTPNVLEPDARIRIAHMVGIGAETQERWSWFRLSDPVPASDAISSNQPVVIPTVGQIRSRYPGLGSGLPTEDHALVVMPLSVGERRLGALTVSFFGDGGFEIPEFGSEDLAFLTSLSDVCAQALDRANAVRSLRSASARLAFLAEASVELSSSLDYTRTLQRVAELAVPVLADWCTVATVEAGELQTLALAHIDPDRVSLAQELERRYPRDRDTSAIYRVLSTRLTEVYPEVSDEQIAVSAVDDEHRRLLQEIGPMRSVMMVPMVARERALGVLTLVSSSEERRFGPEDVALAEDLSRRAALAIDNAALFRDATGV